MRLLIFSACTVLLAVHTAIAATRHPDTSSRPLAELAAHEGEVVVYGSTSERFARYLVDEFNALHPTITVKYVSLPPRELDARMRQEASGDNGPDVVWSNGMDLQMKAALDGLAQAYRSPEAASLPSWAKWRDRLYATTYEPVVLVYNRRLVPADKVPTTHEELRERLTAKAGKFRGKVSTYKLDNVEVGSLPFRLDVINNPRFWELLRVMRADHLDEQASSAGILDRISSGQSLVAYNIAGEEAIRRARRDPLIGVQFTLDYTLVASRVMFIAKHAPHPAAARLWVDFILSKRGQQQMQVADMFPIREDVSGIDAGLVLLRQATKVAKPIALDSKLATLCAPAAAQAFSERWQAVLYGAPYSRPPEIGTLTRTSRGHARSALSP
jgi:iron(III) transport system substrate-binding protein